METKKKLAGRRVLVVEDQYFIADELRRILTEEGADVIGPTPNAQHALASIERGTPDFALLDINLGDDDAYPVARELMRRGTPFVFVTGYLHAAIPAEFQSVPHVDKPFDTRRILSALSQSAEQTVGGGLTA